MRQNVLDIKVKDSSDLNMSAVSVTAVYLTAMYITAVYVAAFSAFYKTKCNKLQYSRRLLTYPEYIL